MVGRIGLVLLVLVLSVSGQGFGDTIAPGDGVAPIADVVTSAVSRGLASLRSQRVEFNTGEERRAEIRRAADELLDVDNIARRALGQHCKGLLSFAPFLEPSARSRLAAGLLLGAAAYGRWR